MLYVLITFDELKKQKSKYVSVFLLFFSSFTTTTSLVGG